MLMKYNERDGVTISGYDMESRGAIVTESRSHIVIKWSAGTHWSGIGMRDYHSPQIIVYKKQRDGDSLPCQVDRVIEWDVTRKFEPQQPKQFKREV